MIAAALAEDRDCPQRASLAAYLREGLDQLASGARALDVVESVVCLLEDDPLFNAGRGAVLNAAGEHELEASIMDGATLGAGAVIGLRTVRHPIRLARLVMERTEHVALHGAGAEAFADSMGVERVAPDWFTTPERVEQWKKARAMGAGTIHEMHDAVELRSGTVGCVALDSKGDLAAATSTGGRTNKMPGRMGDSPVIGAGTYASNRSCAVSGTGWGEQFLRHLVAREVAALIEYRGLSLAEATDELVRRRLRPGDGGVIAVSARGEIAMPFNTPGMFRAAGNHEGMFVVGIGPEH